MPSTSTAHLRSSEPGSPACSIARWTQRLASSSVNASRCSSRFAVAAGLLNQRWTAAASSGRKSLSEMPRAISVALPAEARGRLLLLGRLPQWRVGGRPRIRVDCHVTRPAEQRARGAGEDAEIQPGRAVLDVPDVELDSLLPGDPGPTVNLSPSRHPGTQ